MTHETLRLMNNLVSVVLHDEASFKEYKAAWNALAAYIEELERKSAYHDRLMAMQTEESDNCPHRELPKPPHVEPNDADEQAAWEKNEAHYLEKHAFGNYPTAMRYVFGEGWSSAVLWYEKQRAKSLAHSETPQD